MWIAFYVMFFWGVAIIQERGVIQVMGLVIVAGSIVNHLSSAVINRLQQEKTKEANNRLIEMYDFKAAWLTVDSRILPSDLREAIWDIQSNTPPDVKVAAARYIIAHGSPVLTSMLIDIPQENIWSLAMEALKNRHATPLNVIGLLNSEGTKNTIVVVQ